MTRLIAVIDGRVFPALKVIITNRWHILIVLSFLAVLLNPGTSQTIQLILGNYTNVGSFVVGGIVLRETLTHHREVTRLHHKIDALHTHIVSADTAQTASKEETAR